MRNSEEFKKQTREFMEKAFDLVTNELAKSISIFKMKSTDLTPVMLNFYVKERERTLKIKKQGDER